MARNEKELCKILASYLDASYSVVIKGVEADITADDEAVEVKLYPARFYEGFGQALALKYVAEVGKVAVIHFVKSIPGEYLNALKRLCESTGIAAAVYSEVSGLHVVKP